ncbi:colanic acid biosynthesis glycosyl transferase WcaI [Cryobacterium sp. MP_3.1]|uniref:glycosyltransferase n=1 Tax=Cryobacterium sp. MP_3.1 TaxID=3071711 RepID=UPI002DFF565A|nr:colanic acid biosynthesis glycosyl transferase WcaI [Cryobacterium sp. MP_3.1]
MVDQPRPKILVIGLNYAPEMTGIAPYTSGLARGLRGGGQQVRVLTANPHYPEWKVHSGYGGFRNSTDDQGVLVTRLAHYVPARPEGIKRLVSELSFGLHVLFARWYEPDIVVMVSPALFATALAMIRARWGRRKPIVNVWVQDIYSLGMSETSTGGGLAARLITWVEKTTLAAAAGVVVIHDRFGEYLVGRLGVSAERIEVVRNWTHVGAGNSTNVPATRALHGWSPNETIVLHAGNMGVKQGLENVVHAARLADEQNRPVRFVLLGNGSQRDELQALGATITRLQFIASLDEAGFQDALSAADVLLVNEKPGVSEMAVPSKLTSYFNAARPVIGATDPGGLTASEIESAEAGRIVLAGDPQALLDSALELGSDPELARSLGENGFRYRTDVLGEAAAIDRFASWLRTLMNRSLTHR